MGNGIAAVKEKDKWHLIDEKGKKVTDDEYDEIAMDEKGVVYRNDRIFAKAAGKYYLLDENGKRLQMIPLRMQDHSMVKVMLL